MENENVKTTKYNAQDFMMAFASSFEKNVQAAAQNENYETEDDLMNTDPDLRAFAFDDHVNIDDEEDIQFLEPEADDVEQKEDESPVELTPRQIKKAERAAKKQAKWDKKEAKRNAKIDRQQRNNTRVMLGGAIFLGIICILLLVMNFFHLSFGDIPDVLSGNKTLSSSATTTMPLAINDASSDPTPPPKGNYIVTAEDGVYLRESASSSASRVAVLENGAKIAVSAFRYDSENECFWGRAGINGTYGWVLMSALTMDNSQTEAVSTTSDSLG